MYTPSQTLSNLGNNSHQYGSFIYYSTCLALKLNKVKLIIWVAYNAECLPKVSLVCHNPVVALKPLTIFLKSSMTSF